MNLLDLPAPPRAPNRSPSRKPKRPHDPAPYVIGLEMEIVRLLEVVRLLQEALELADQRLVEHRMHRFRA